MPRNCARKRKGQKSLTNLLRPPLFSWWRMLAEISCRARDDIQVDGLRNEPGEEVKFLAVGTVHARQAFE
jgi:hypothetical protein